MWAGFFLCEKLIRATRVAVLQNIFSLVINVKISLGNTFFPLKRAPSLFDHSQVLLKFLEILYAL